MLIPPDETLLQELSPGRNMGLPGKSTISTISERHAPASIRVRNSTPLQPERWSWRRPLSARCENGIPHGGKRIHARDGCR